MVNLSVVHGRIYFGYTLGYIPHNASFLYDVHLWPGMFLMREIYLMVVSYTCPIMQWFLII